MDVEDSSQQQQQQFSKTISTSGFESRKKEAKLNSARYEVSRGILISKFILFYLKVCKDNSNTQLTIDGTSKKERKRKRSSSPAQKQRRHTLNLYSISLFLLLGTLIGLSQVLPAPRGTSLPGIETVFFEKVLFRPFITSSSPSSTTTTTIIRRRKEQPHQRSDDNARLFYREEKEKEEEKTRIIVAEQTEQKNKKTTKENLTIIAMQEMDEFSKAATEEEANILARKTKSPTPEHELFDPMIGHFKTKLFKPSTNAAFFKQKLR